MSNSKIETTENQSVHSHLVLIISIDKLISSNSMVSPDIWEKHTLMSFSKTPKFSMFLKNSLVHVFPKLHSKPSYYLYKCK